MPAHLKNMKGLLFIALALACLSFLVNSCSPQGSGYRYAHGGTYIGSNPSISPDGSKIIFGSTRYGVGDICVINSDGSNWVRLTDTEAYEGEPVFSPDGSKIAFVSERDGLGEVYIMNSNGSNQTRLTHSKFYDAHPTFSSDGKKIMFTRMLRKEKWFWDYNEIFTINTDGSEERRLTNNRVAECNPSFSPDGARILYQEVWNDEIYVMRSDATDVVRLGSGTKPVFSPDGQKIVFVAPGVPGVYEIYIMNSDGSNPTQLTDTKGYNTSPSFSLDGSKIIFLAEPKGGLTRGNGQICIMNIDGSDLKVISNNY